MVLSIYITKPFYSRSFDYVPSHHTKKTLSLIEPNYNMYDIHRSLRKIMYVSKYEDTQYLISWKTEKGLENLPSALHINSRLFQ